MSAKIHPSFKERIQASPFIGKSVEVGDFFWGDGVTLHSNSTMKQHLGFENNKNKNRKRRCFYILQIINESLVLACTTTTRNSNGWNEMPEENFKYFLPIDQTPEVRDRRAITVCNDWEGAFKPGKSLLYLEDIEALGEDPWAVYVKQESQFYEALVRYVLHFDSKGLIILPEAKRPGIRHSCKFRIERHTYEPKPAKVDAPIASIPVAEKLEATSPHTITPEQSCSNGLPRTMISKRPSPINELTAHGAKVNQILLLARAIVKMAFKKFKGDGSFGVESENSEMEGFFV
ncbi:hypothetical protein RUND412_002401 [Rhizina undulata]